MSVYSKISQLPPSNDAPTDDDTPPSGGRKVSKDAENNHSKPTKPKSAADAGTASLLGSKDDFLFSVANSPTRKRDFDLNDFNI